VLGRKHSREMAKQITFFKSVGVAVQDAVAAQVAVQNALRLGLGQQGDWKIKFRRRNRSLCNRSCLEIK
jgi:ornithine cyclodeaminase/alanine dehydrogenase-like protein (mu-crystallin family)